MKLTVLSDIHDNVWKLGAALEKIREITPDAMICCGDLCSPFIVDLLARTLRDEQAGVLAHPDPCRLRQQRSRPLLHYPAGHLV